jgi:hypothetical protein
MACQSSRQIRRHVSLLRKLTGDKTLRESSLPFDWLICPPESAAHMLADSASFPDSPGEIQYQGGWPRWVKYNAYFWHEFLVRGTHIPIAEGFEKSRSKFLHLWQKFANLSAVPRRIFFISNTQNNLDKVQEWTRTIDPMFTPEPIEQLIRSVNARFPCGENEFVVVSYTSRLRPGSTFKGARMELIQKDPSDWEGSDDEWDRVLAKTFAAK